MTFLISKDKIFWDLGVTIHSEKNMQGEKIVKPLIANTQIAPQYKTLDNMSKLSLMTSGLSPNHIIKLLYVSERYAELVEYVKNLPMQKTPLLDDNQTMIYADALYRLGEYEQAINSLNAMSELYPIDEKYFLLALYNKKLGNIDSMSTYLNNLISNYPNSEYFKLAKLQTQILK